MEHVEVIIRKEINKKLKEIRRTYNREYGKRATLDSLIARRIDHFIGPNRPKKEGEKYGQFIQRIHQCRHYCRGFNHDLSDPSKTAVLSLRKDTFESLVKLKDDWSEVHRHEISYDDALAGMMHFAWTFTTRELFPE